ncbi:MAG: bifunctional 2-C-methyl-D-erythritol 4-phosphate cytidylyltransferase/2-C-methyl-D-erythritol 2,4-cyclodiphosphate synthase [Roseinatronobacter sp.]
MGQDIAAIIVAAGRGTRAGEGLPKQWRDLCGRTVLEHTLEAFRDAGLHRLVVVIHPDDQALVAQIEDSDLVIVEGGATRRASVQNALEALSKNPPVKVLIHDGARPLVSRSVIHSVIDALDNSAAAAPALAVVDALWSGSSAGDVIKPVPRDGLFRAQTPQGFGFSEILHAHRTHVGNAADDVEIALGSGLDVKITEGCADNIKLTYPADFARAESILSQRNTPQMTMRVGNGYDVHRFGPGSGCWLCGVLVPHSKTLQGHSDADVGMHALTDAIYGALGEGDIGQHFPPSDPQWKGAASEIFLRHAIERTHARGYRLGNCDITLVCETPKIGPHAATMCSALAKIMNCDPDCISVKATTSERLGFTGREEGIAAIATVCLIRI